MINKRNRDAVGAVHCGSFPLRVWRVFAAQAKILNKSIAEALEEAVRAWVKGQQR